LSAHRRPEIRFSDAPRGVCRWCGDAIVHEKGEKRGEPNRRRRWHQACVDEYNRSDPREARRMVRKRDRGHCASCGLDTYALKRSTRGKGSHRKLRELGFKPRKSLWELDHVVPLIEAAEASRRGDRRRSETARQAEDDVLAAVDAALEKSRHLLAQLGATPARDGAPR
jgi:hypothetical protein